ncbi:hypothetical protein B296_00028860 [Ensete ventricosum]|uniref:Uncharacterized protein n=1 Tax=Ensete ventricosum TaxID=4639 RepID=A0A427AM60_ENSVE|nr:hypothetical protein B296_00028860 [Ensete ventricosum]
MRTARYWAVPCVSSRGNEATRRRLVRCMGTRRHLIFQRANKAPPRLPTGERGDASSPRTGARRYLVLPRDEVFGALRMSVKMLLMWNSKMFINGGGDALVATSLLEASNLIVLKVV